MKHETTSQFSVVQYGKKTLCALLFVFSLIQPLLEHHHSERTVPVSVLLS
jgi:hypothetical protein